MSGLPATQSDLISTVALARWTKIENYFGNRFQRFPDDFLIEHRGAALSRDELLNEVWGYEAAVSTRTVDVHVAWLRQKLEANQRYPEYILTIHGVGYKFTG